MTFNIDGRRIGRWAATRSGTVSGRCCPTCCQRQRSASSHSQPTPGIKTPARSSPNALLIAGCAFTVGGLLGFLFGIPRSLTGDPGRASTTENSSTGGDAPTRTGYESNTNLEQISDWLTKILVGVGLVELGKLDTTIRHLGAALAPAFGDAPSSESAALATCFLYSVTGFLIVYLATRVYLPRVFAQADLLDQLKQTQQGLDQLREDANALALMAAQFDSDSSSHPDRSDLENAIKGSTQPVRTQIFSRAREHQVRARRDNVPAQINAVIPVFRALIAADDRNQYHRNQPQLGYALLRGEPSDPAAAEEELSKAIEIRDRRKLRGWRTYEAHRALARILIDPQNKAKKPSDDATKASIVDDLASAITDDATWRNLKKDEEVGDWMTRNGVTPESLRSPTNDSPADPGT